MTRAIREGQNTPRNPRNPRNVASDLHKRPPKVSNYPPRLRGITPRNLPVGSAGDAGDRNREVLLSPAGPQPINVQVRGTSAGDAGDAGDCPTQNESESHDR